MKINFLFFLFFPFTLMCQNYYTPTNFAPLNITQKGEHAFSFSGHQFKNIKNLKLIYSQSPFQYFFINAGGLIHWNSFSQTSTERINLIDFSSGGYYFFSFEKNKKKRYRDGLLKKLLRKPQRMEYGILTSIGLGYTFGKTTEIFERGKGTFYFQKWNAQFRFQIQTPRWGVAYFGKVGTLNFNKGKLERIIEPWILETAENFEEKNHYFLWEASIRLYFGNDFGQIYFDKVTLHTKSKLASNIGRSYLLVGGNIYLSKILGQK